MTYTKRVDSNHGEIKAIFERLLAGHCTDTSGYGVGAGDLYVSFGGESGPSFGAWIEIKSSEQAKLTRPQIEFRKRHPGVHYRCESTEHAVEICAYIRRQVGLLARRTCEEKD